MNQKNFFGYSLSVLLTGIAVEVICMLVVETGFIPCKTPSYTLQYSPIWLADINPYFGVWHPPSIKHKHRKSCFEVLIQTNSYGAVDSERARNSEQPRTVVIGDSFVEGYGVEMGLRFTNILEKETGRPFLNFGTSGNFGPTQYQLLYKHLASQFDHDQVLIMLLPDNDFMDQYPREGRYQPYLEGVYPDYQLNYTLKHVEDSYAYHENPEKRSFLAIALEYSYALNVAYWAISKKRAHELPVNSEEEHYSGYFDYKEEELMKLRYNLQQIKDIARDRQIYIVSIPRLNDFLRFEEEQYNRLGEDLDKMSMELNLEFYDLLPELANNYSGQWEKLFHSCDGHWSEEGHRVAAELIKNRMSY